MSETTINGISALELTMRDVMENMSEMAYEMAFADAVPGCFEILAIEPPEDDSHLQIPEPVHRPITPFRPKLVIDREQERAVA